MTSPSRVQLPKIRKILQTNLVNINYLLKNKSEADQVFLNSRKKLYSTRRFNETKSKKIKTSNGSPVDFDTIRDENKLSSYFAKQITTLSKIDIFDEKKYDSKKSIEDPKLKCFSIDKEEHIPTKKISNTYNFHRGLSGYNISKLYKNRNKVKGHPIISLNY